MRRFAKVYVLAIVSAALLILTAAIIHKSGISSPGYIHSPLIAVQLFGLVALFVTIPASIALAVVASTQKREKETIGMVGCILIPIVTFVAAASVNSETLLYMT